MASRLWLKHNVSLTEPSDATLGDEWYNPSTNILSKRLVVDGTNVRFVPLGGGLEVQQSGTTIVSYTSILNFPGSTVTHNSVSGVTDVVPPTISAAGSNTNIQFNNSGSLGGSSNFTWNNATQTLAVTGFTTSNQVRALGGLNATVWTTTGPIFNTSGSLTDTSGSGGTVALRVGSSFNNSSWLSSVSTTITNAATLYVDAPTASTNTTFTNSWGIYNNGAQYIGGRILIGASSTNYFQAIGNTTGNSPILSVEGSDANISAQIRSKGTGLIAFANASGQFGAYVNPVASGVNHLELRSATTTNSPVLAVQGSDTNATLSLTPKGTGLIRCITSTGVDSVVRVERTTATAAYIDIIATSGEAIVRSGGAYGIQIQTNAGTRQLQVSNTTSAVNYLQVTGAVTTANPTISTQGSDANAGLTIAAKGTGSVLINSLFRLAVTTAATAAGTTQATATLLTTPITNVTSVAASSGVRLPDNTPIGMRIVVRNSGASNLNVYPQVGGQINALGTNAAFVAEVSTNLEFIAVSTTQWYTLNATFA